jgi:hypothetical protein
MQNKQGNWIKRFEKQNRMEDCDTYLTHVCSGAEPGENIKYKIELSANTVAFISCRSRLTKVLAGGRGK